MVSRSSMRYQPVRVFLDGLEKLGGDLGLVLCAVNERLDVALDERERRAQLVADVGDKLFPCAPAALVVRS
jgi:hypothetical protein